MGLLEALLPGLRRTCQPKRKFRLIDAMKTLTFWAAIVFDEVV
tara:strand:+ start:267 stop:395 length:129 start_codon:yes stop_codon:yes gene_type:complete